MATIVEYLSNEQLQVGILAEEGAKRLNIADSRGRTHRIAPDKVLFRHGAPSIAALVDRLQGLQQQIDIELLWETLDSEGDRSPREAAALARLYFDREDSAHVSAMLRTLWGQQLHFKRRGRQFAPRTRSEIEHVQRMRASEQQLAAEQAHLGQAVDQRSIDDDLAQRIVRWIQGAKDRALDAVLQGRSRDAPRWAFEFLIQSGKLQPSSDFEVIQAGLDESHPQACVIQAARTEPVRGDGPLESAAFTIDDPDTLEVDDAISVSSEGEHLRVDVDIADVAAQVTPDDAVDREALRRGATVYLPTQRYYMLPEALGTDRGSLRVGQERRALRTSVWLDDQGEVQRYELKRCWIRVEQRLDYEQADQLLEHGKEPTAEALRRLKRIAEGLRQRRRERGALILQRPEWKIRADPQTMAVEVKPIALSSASRMLVGEMMILTNAIAAKLAVDENLPVIFRTQPQPNADLPPLDPADPFALFSLRGLISGASLSLEAGPHWGLGLSCYTQVTSPLRRYADLVQQRQICAHLDGTPPPYDSQRLLKVLATVEATDQQMRRVEAATTLRWALEYVALGERKNLDARVTGQVSGGLKLMLLHCGAEGLLSGGDATLPIGSPLKVDVERINPRRGVLRLCMAAHQP